MKKKTRTVILICLGALVLIVSATMLLLRNVEPFYGVTIGGREYICYYTFRLKPLTEGSFDDLALGTTYGETIARYGRQDGEMNYNGLWTSVFYKIRNNQYAVLCFDFKTSNSYDLPLTGIYIYDENGLVQVIREQESEGAYIPG